MYSNNISAITHKQKENGKYTQSAWTFLVLETKFYDLSIWTIEKTIYIHPMDSYNYLD